LKELKMDNKNNNNNIFQFEDILWEKKNL
jgi:hypothetical protein